MMQRSLRSHALAWTAFVVVAACPVAAEESKGRRGFFEYGQLTATSENTEMTLGVRFSSLTANRPAIDVALAEAGYGLAVIPDVDLAYPLALTSNVRFIPRAGVSLLLVGGGGFLGGAIGANVGAGLALDLGSSLSLRADVVARNFAGEELTDDNPFVSYTLGIGWGSGKSRPSITSER